MEAQLLGDGRTRGPSARLLWARIELVAITLLIVTNLGMVSGIFIPLLSNDIAILGGVQLAVILLYGVVAFRNGHAIPLLIAVAVLGYLILSTILFHELAGGKINFNAALTYLLILAFLPFAETRLPLGLVLKIMTIVAVAYVLIYVLCNSLIISITLHEPRLVLDSDGERDRRVFLAFQWALFVFFMGIFTVRTRALPGIGMILFGGAAIILSNSRLLTVLSLPVIAVALLGLLSPRTRRPMAWALAAGFVVLSLITMWGYADHGWNAYAYIARDASGTARFLEFQDAVTAIKGHEWFGVGIAPSGEDLDYFIRPTRPFFAADLGTAGVFFQFGLLGALLFMAYSVLCMVGQPVDDALQTPASKAALYATLHAGFAGFFATSLLGTSATLFGALAIGLWLKGGYYSRRNAGRAGVDINPTVPHLFAYGS